MASQPKQFRVTTKSNPEHRKALNKLDHNFTATQMNEKWTTDITYIHTREGWLFLAVVLDLFSRRIVGWAMDETMEKELVLDAFAMAAQRRPPKNLLHYSDRGSQYTSFAYQSELTRFDMQVSMSRKGNCWDNAVTESFFGTLKTECVNRHSYATRAEARSSIFSYIEGFHNTHRRHSTLAYMSPVEWEQRNENKTTTKTAIRHH